jgi:hypothetical protein
VPQQALYFLNSPFVIDRARALAVRAEGRRRRRGRCTQSRGSTARRFQRDPDRRELEAGIAFLNASRPIAEPPPPPPPPAWR